MTNYIREKLKTAKQRLATFYDIFSHEILYTLGVYAVLFSLNFLVILFRYNLKVHTLKTLIGMTFYPESLSFFNTLV